MWESIILTHLMDCEMNIQVHPSTSPFRRFMISIPTSNRCLTYLQAVFDDFGNDSSQTLSLRPWLQVLTTFYIIIAGE